MAKKIGLFLNGQIMVEYQNTPDCYMEAVQDLKEAIEETGIFHELKLYEEV